MADVQIAVATDMRMFEPTLTAMMSAIEHSSKPVKVHFLGHDISDEARRLLNRAVECRPQTELRFYDLSETLTDGWDDFEWDGRHSAAIRANLSIPKLVEGGRVLYLDSDTITHADIAPLFDMDIKGCHIAAVRDYGFLLSWSEFQPTGLRTASAKALLPLASWFRKRTSAVQSGHLGKIESVLRYYSTGKNPPHSMWRRRMYPYPLYDIFNTGVVIFDVDSIKSEPGLIDKLTDTTDLEDDTRRLIEVMKGRTFILDPCWNALCGIYHRYAQAHEAMVLDGSRYAHEKARIVHHVGVEKPWHDYSLDELRADTQRVRERLYADLNLEAHGHPVSAVFHELKDQECIEEYCDLTNAWRDSHDQYMGMLKK